MRALILISLFMGLTINNAKAQSELERKCSQTAEKLRKYETTKGEPLVYVCDRFISKQKRSLGNATGCVVSYIEGRYDATTGDYFETRQQTKWDRDAIKKSKPSTMSLRYSFNEKGQTLTVRLESFWQWNKWREGQKTLGCRLL
ncbi:hypothetical protein N9O57_01295 [bacterium]|nr:hypothetical protein [bacterium]